MSRIQSESPLFQSGNIPIGTNMNLIERHVAANGVITETYEDGSQIIKDAKGVPIAEVTPEVDLSDAEDFTQPILKTPANPKK